MAITREQYEQARARTVEFYEKASIYMTDQEKATLEVSDFGMGRLDEVGVQLVIYVNTERCSAKEVVLFPHQICPDHRHPPLGPDNPGKEETFRCRWGQFYLYLEGAPTPNPRANVPEDIKPYLTVWHEVVLNPGDQYLVPPNVSHWFQAGPEGAVLTEFSTRNVDEADIFVDPRIKRITEMV